MSASFPSLLFLIRFSLVLLIFGFLPSLIVLSTGVLPPFSLTPPLSASFDLAALPPPAPVSTTLSA